MANPPPRRDPQKKLPAAFWRSDTGAEPVREWLKGLSNEDKYEIGTAIAVVEFGWPVGMPACKPLGGGLFEVRTNLPQGRTARVSFCMYERQMILLHGFIKKTRKTPKGDLDLARERMGELQERSKKEEKERRR